MTARTLVLQLSDDIIAAEQVGEYVHQAIPGSRITYLRPAALPEPQRWRGHVTATIEIDPMQASAASVSLPISRAFYRNRLHSLWCLVLPRSTLEKTNPSAVGCHSQ